MSIIVVDDSDISRKQIETVLRQAGFNDLTLAGSARDLFRELSLDESGRLKRPLDLIIMDVEMPEVSGIDALRRLKAIAALKEIPVVIITATKSDRNLELAFNAGATDFVTKPINRVEMTMRVRSVIRQKHDSDQKRELMERLSEANTRLARMTVIDGLTGLSNRRHLDYTLSNEIRRARRNTTPLTIMMLDIDYFKNFNDHYGHLLGDDCLKVVAKTLRKMASRPADLVARYGGEEFLIMLPETNMENGTIFAEKLRAAIETLALPHEKSLVSNVVTISLGLATYEPSAEAAAIEESSLVKAADQALYKAKNSGRNRVETTML